MLFRYRQCPCACLEPCTFPWPPLQQATGSTSVVKGCVCLGCGLKGLLMWEWRGHLRPGCGFCCSWAFVFGFNYNFYNFSDFVFYFFYFWDYDYITSFPSFLHPFLFLNPFQIPSLFLFYYVWLHVCIYVCTYVCTYIFLDISTKQVLHLRLRDHWGQWSWRTVRDRGLECLLWDCTS